MRCDSCGISRHHLPWHCWLLRADQRAQYVNLSDAPMISLALSLSPSEARLPCQGMLAGSGCARGNRDRTDGRTSGLRLSGVAFRWL